MPYITASGVSIPQGTDAFTPPTQFKAWGDKAATYENRVTVSVDADRTSLAAPVLRDGIDCYVISTGITWQYRGTTWKPWSSDWTMIPIGSAVVSGLSTGSSGTSAFAWRYHAGRVVYKGYVTIQSGGSWVSPILALPVPAVTPYYPTKRYPLGGGDLLDVSASVNYPLAIFANRNATEAGIATAGSPAAGITNSSPFANAAGDSLSFEFEYDPA